MTRREVLRGEIKYLKNFLGIDTNTGKLDSIEECREAIINIINIINEKARVISANEKAATDDIKGKYYTLLVEHKTLQQNYTDLLAILKNIQAQSKKKSFFKRLFGGK